MTTGVSASVQSRILAKAIDFGLVILAAAILPRVIGPLLGFAYSLLADGMPFEKFQGQSIGKRLMGLQVVSTTRRAPANVRDSLVRNAPVGFATFFAIIPVWGWIFLILIGFPLVVMEIYLMIRMKTGDRLGDVMADTEVVQLQPGPPPL